METLIQLPATLQSYRSMSNRSVRIVFDTNENLTNVELNYIATNHEKYGHLLFLSESTTPSEVQEMIARMPPLVLEQGEKSPAEQLRNILYIYWEQKVGKEKWPEFPQFYKHMMLGYVQVIKDKLN